ncbi:Gfo/Idh/MocA family oxidoreductase [Deinococcus rubellus]|uniref:Gfo/Idh/MocA family protein n=1 Tax=Deinococcus rubellus TaxID=1889240 RepID=UPI0031ED79CE
MTFRWGILGAARIARAFIPAIRAAGGEVVMLGSREPQSARVQTFANDWSIARTGSYQELIDTDLDAVYISLPNALHLPWSAAALRAGKHVLTEKPLTLNAQEARQLADVASQTQRVLLEGFAYRFTPQHRALMDAVHGGQLGEVRAYRGAFGFTVRNSADIRLSPELGGGALYDIGCYPVNEARMLLGEPLAVTAQARWTPDGVDVSFSAVLDYSHVGSGALASIDCGFDWLSGGRIGRSQVLGTGGVMELDRAFFSDEPEFTLTRDGQPQELAPGNGYALMAAHFQRVARGEEAALYPPEDAVQQAIVLDALLQSAREGRRIVL